MKRIMLDIDDTYVGALSVTAVGATTTSTHITTYVADLEDGDHIIIGNDGKATQHNRGVTYD